MRQVVRTLLRNPQGKFLLVKHLKSKTWTLPGGHIDKGESLHKALKREIKEEFNLKIDILGEEDDFGMEHVFHLPLPLAIYKIEYESKSWGHTKKTEYIFLSEVHDLEGFHSEEKEIAEYKWLTHNEIIEMSDVFEQIPKLLEKIK